MADGRHFENRYIAISQWRITGFWWNFVHSSRFWTGWTSSSSSFLACNSRLRSAIRRHHPQQRAVLSQICCFGERKVVLFQILLDGAKPRDAGTPSCLLQSAVGEANRILLESALSSMRIICPNRVSRCDWIIAVSWVASLASVHNHSIQIGSIWCQAAYADTTGRVQCIDLTCVRLRYRPAVRTIQEYW